MRVLFRSKPQQFGIEPLDRAIGNTARCAQPLLEHMPRPASDHRPHRRLGERRALHQRERMIDRRGKVAERVEKGAIEIEADNRKRKSHGPLSVSVSVERSEEHTSELQSLMRNSYAVFCLKKNNTSDI